MNHNDYSFEVPPKFEIFPDRLEITSAGRLPESLSREEFFTGISIPRNKELMRIYRDLDIVESLGSGIPRILRSYGEDCFHFTDNFIRITFPASVRIDYASASASATENKTEKTTEKWPEKWPEKWLEKGQKILDAISNDKSITIAKLEVELRIGHTTLKKILREMQNENIIRRVGPDKGGHWEIVNNDVK